MRDQAFDLRNLARRAAREDAARAGPPPWLVALTGAKGGVGTTTLAVNLSVALCEQGLRVLLVDADFGSPDVAAVRGMEEQGSIRDVLTARRDIHEVLQPGPAGLQVLPGLWAPDAISECSEIAQTRLIQQLKTMGRHAEVVVLDTGAGPNEVTGRFWNVADQIVLAAAPDDVAVMDSYATIKALAPQVSGGALQLIINRAPEDQAARDACARVDRSCQRFLGLEVKYLGRVPAYVAAAPEGGRAALPVLNSPDAPAARQIERVAGQLAAQLSPRGRRAHDVA